MFKKYFCFLCLIMGWLPGGKLLFAQETKAAPILKKSIVYKWTTLEGMNYYFSGLKVTDYKNLEKIILPMDDPESTRLLRQSEDSRIWGSGGILSGDVIFIIGGVRAVNDFGANRNSNGFQDLGVAVSGLGINRKIGSGLENCSLEFFSLKASPWPYISP